MDDHDKTGRIRAKGVKTPIHHSALSEHFEGAFPFYMNRWEEGFDLRKHDHAYLEIVYVVAGEGYHYVSDQVEKAEKGCLYVLPVGTSHVLRPKGASGKLAVYNLCIRPEFVSEWKRWLSGIGAGVDGDRPFAMFDGPPGSHVALSDRSMEFVPMFERLHREFTERSLGYETIVFGLVMQLIVGIARRLRPDRGAFPARPAASAFAEVLEYIHSHLAERLTVEQLAERFGMSARHFIRRFQLATDMNFTEYVQLKRIERACGLLVDTDHKIASIAKQTGYQDAAHFSEVFRRLIGIGPSQYRKGAERTK
ncbi:AraC family transcriptional regulator [Paenibacillus sp.]|uniref:AraC family transcriptional regulator n=1 Tax=Paenibacillus sp. TaxID=58172 RepID=UPI002D62F261|nr:AraC family transcriptional regulator [Paenibacillus sp.]HZG85949.1 AraC family transcriptional regulator [Paenibacillus sp.]